METITTEREEPKVAIITDLHGDTETAREMKEFLQTQEIDGVVLAGDTPDNTKANFTWMIKNFRRLKVPVIVFPGSHENSFLYKEVLKGFKNDTNVIDGMKQENWRVRIKGYELLLIPGSDTVARGTTRKNGGNMWLVTDKETPQLKVQLTKKIKKVEIATKAEPVFFDNVKKVVSKKTNIPRTRQIVISHIPLQCTKKNSIDVARFGKAQQEFTLKKKDFTKKELALLSTSRTETNFSETSVLPLKEARIIHKKGYPIRLHNKNVGSKAIRKLLNKHNITKFICGHIHEAGPKAIDKKERKLKKSWNKEFFANNGPGNEGNLTLLTLRKDGKVKHEFVNVKKR
ncbi:MAG: metallophosphoesterase family protein [Nanobdellota archaeon]